VKVPAASKRPKRDASSNVMQDIPLVIVQRRDKRFSVCFLHVGAVGVVKTVSSYIAFLWQWTREEQTRCMTFLEESDMLLIVTTWVVLVPFKKIQEHCM
jgi:hypothetical protein